MQLPIYQVDAFTGRLFGGNPAAVVILAEWLPDAVMQAIAAENNLAETAFVLPQDGEFGLRWFTPEVEIDLCGHATLASACVLIKHGFAPSTQVVFRYTGGTLHVAKEGDWYTMRFPSRPATVGPDDVHGRVAAALGASPSEIHQARDLLAVFDTQQAVAALRPDFAAVAALDAFAVIASAPGQASDFVSRFFAPRAGIPEDPVTGSSHCTLIPYWSARLGKSRLHALQISPRGGELFCEDLGEEVMIAGRAVEYLQGHIEVPD